MLSLLCVPPAICTSACLPQFVNYHRETGADITIGCIPYGSERAKEFGLMKIDNNRRVMVSCWEYQQGRIDEAIVSCCTHLVRLSDVLNLLTALNIQLCRAVSSTGQLCLLCACMMVVVPAVIC
jgi:hypothetical protein